MPEQIAPDGDAAMVTDGTDAAWIESVPKLVPPTPVVIPTTPKSELAMILPDGDKADVACICRLLIVITSI